jgi:hypothetical protein
MLTLRANDFRHILPELVKSVQESGVAPRLARIEGVMGVGKSQLANMLADELSAEPHVVHGDHYAYPDKSNRPYAQAIDVNAFRARVGLFMRPKPLVVRVNGAV